MARHPKTRYSKQKDLQKYTTMGNDVHSSTIGESAGYDEELYDIKSRGYAADVKAARNKRDEWFYTYGYQNPPDRKVTIQESPDEPAILGNVDLYQHFRGISAEEARNRKRYSRPLTVLDIETGHNNEPISVSAVKGVMDLRRGEFRVLDTFERYYVPEKTYTSAYNMALETHKITRDRALSYRAQQQANYPERYNETERQRLLTFLRDSVVGGQNVNNFDFQHLGIINELQELNTIDTMIVGENMNLRKTNLEYMYKFLFGMTMRQAGYEHHRGIHDVFATIDVLAAMYRYGGDISRDLRWVLARKGYSYAPFEDVWGTGVVKGGFRNAMKIGAYMTAEDFRKAMTLDYLNEFDDDGNLIPRNNVYIEGPDAPKTWEEEYGLGQLGVDALGVIKKLHNQLIDIKGVMSEYVNAQGDRLVQMLAGMDEATAEEWLLSHKGYKNKDDRDKLLAKAAIIKQARQNKQLTSSVNSTSSYLLHHWRKGNITEDQYYELSELLNTESGYTPLDIRYKAREAAAETKAMRKGVEEERALQDAAILGDLRSFANELNSDTSNEWDREDAIARQRYLDKQVRHHKITRDQADKLNLDNLSGSFDDLVDATDAVIQKNQELYKIMSAIGNIKFYDINQYVRSAQSQWSGITSAAKGVVPSFVLNPASRLGDAFFNSVNAQLTGYNAIQRTWASGIGDAIIGVGGAVGGIPGMAIGMGVKGLISAGSQVYGNYKQARMEKAGYDIQNSLNVTGALFSWIATPFQLLYKATKLLTGSFGLLTNRIKNFMSNSIGLMSQMGNPLTEMTGVDYGTYQGLSMVDIASLFNKGTMNSTIEDYVKQAKALYTTGEVNTSRMIAASMLGVFNDVYDPNASQDTYMNMANKVLRSMQGQSDEQKANTMYWATRIDSSLPSLLRTAEALGVTDIRTLMDPTKGRNWMYWHPLDEGEASNFRWTQYEWGAATTQLSNSKMRIGDRMWNAFGRDIFNAFNELVDALANEDWDTALSSITVMWNKVKETVKSLWEGFNKDGGLSDGLEKGLSKIKEWGITAATGIIKIWDDVFTAIVKKLGGLIAYLSTLHLDVKWENGGVTFGLSSISDVVTPGDSTRLYDTQASQYSSRQVARKDMANLIGLSETLGLSKYASIGDVRKRLTEMSNIPALNANGDYVMGNGLSWKKVQAYLASKGIMYDNPNQMTPDEISRIIDTLYAGSAWEYGYTEQAALAKSGLGSHASQEFIYDTPAYRTSQELLASLDAILVDSVKSLTGKDTGKVDIVITMPDGRSATIQTNNGVVTNMTGVSALSGAGSGMKVDVRSQSNQYY